MMESERKLKVPHFSRSTHTWAIFTNLLCVYVLKRVFQTAKVTHMHIFTVTKGAGIYDFLHLLF